MTTGQPLRLRVAMKPLSSLPRPMETVELDTHEPAVAITQRSDTVAEIVRNLDAYLAEVATR